jgi:hypothetical protein
VRHQRDCFLLAIVYNHKYDEFMRVFALSKGNGFFVNKTEFGGVVKHGGGVDLSGRVTLHTSSDI